MKIVRFLNTADHFSHQDAFHRLKLRRNADHVSVAGRHRLYRNQSDTFDTLQHWDCHPQKAIFRRSIIVAKSPDSGLLSQNVGLFRDPMATLIAGGCVEVSIIALSK